MSSTLPAVNMATLILGATTLLEDTRDNRRKASDAKSLASDAYDLAIGWRNSGDRLRMEDPKVRDLIVGLSVPSQAPSEQPSAFAGSPVVTERPAFTEEMVSGSEPTYPPKVNLYDGYGRLLHPSQAIEGSNVLTGQALNFSEIRAQLLGCTFETMPSLEEVTKIFRHNRGLTTAIRELAELTSEEAAEAWRRFFGSSAHGSQLLWVLNDDSATLNAAGTGVFSAFTLKANALKVGETAILYCSPRLPPGAVNENFTPSVVIGGTTVWQPDASMNPNTIGITNACTTTIEVRFTRRTDDPTTGLARFRVSGGWNFGIETGFGCMCTGSAPEVQIAHNVDQLVEIKGLFSAALSVKLTEGKLIREA